MRMETKRKRKKCEQRQTNDYKDAYTNWKQLREIKKYKIMKRLITFKCFPFERMAGAAGKMEKENSEEILFCLFNTVNEGDDESEMMSNWSLESERE